MPTSETAVWALGGATAQAWRELKTVVVESLRGEATLAACEALAGVKLYQLETGGFPESLEELVPEYLAGTPTDPFSGEPLKYSRTESGATVYSVGYDMKDDLARKRADPDRAFAEGDYVFEIR